MQHALAGPGVPRVHSARGARDGRARTPARRATARRWRDRAGLSTGASSPAGLPDASAQPAWRSMRVTSHPRAASRSAQLVPGETGPHHDRRAAPGPFVAAALPGGVRPASRACGRNRRARVSSKPARASASRTVPATVQVARVAPGAASRASSVQNGGRPHGGIPRGRKPVEVRIASARASSPASIAPASPNSSVSVMRPPARCRR